MNALAIIIGYFLGSIPCGYLIGLYGKGIDIRQYGSGNIGTTNAFRVLGSGWGILVFACDLLKGVLAIFIARWLISDTASFMLIWVGIAAIAGHNWSIFLGFRGGRGVATAGGVILALAPLAILSLAVIWGGTVLLTRYVSVGSMVAAVMAPLIMYWWGHSWEMTFLGLAGGIFVFYRHLPNLERLRRGVEPKIGKRKKDIKY